MANVSKKEAATAARRRSRSGQGITEYACVIAFVAVLVTLAFSLSNGKLLPAVSAAFGAAATNVNQLSTAAATTSS